MRRSAAPFGGRARQNQINDHTTASANILWLSQGNGKSRYQKVNPPIL